MIAQSATSHAKSYHSRTAFSILPENPVGQFVALRSTGKGQLVPGLQPWNALSEAPASCFFFCSWLNASNMDALGMSLADRAFRGRRLGTTENAVPGNLNLNVN